MNETADKLDAAAKVEQNAERKRTLEMALNKINGQYRKLSRLFIAAYNDNNFSIIDMENII